MTFTKEQLQQIIETDHVQCGDAAALARELLESRADAEPVGLFAKRGGTWLELCVGDTFEHPDAVPLYMHPVEVNDAMAYAFHHALSDSSLGTEEVEEIKAGLRAALANVTAPVVVPDEFKEQPAPVAVIKSSPALYGFYCKYNEWLQSGYGCFGNYVGLCANLFDYCDQAGVESEPVLEEMHAQFKSAGLDEKLPFNCSNVNYQNEQDARGCHKNDARRNWVLSRVNDGVLSEASNSKPAPVVPNECTDKQAVCWMHSMSMSGNYRDGWNDCRAAMLQGKAEPLSQGDELPAKCWCHTCRPVTMADMRFVVCPECGNKRCPHASDHRNVCTGSNEPGQEGSAYPAAPKQEVKP